MIQVDLGLGLRISTCSPSDAITAGPGATLCVVMFHAVLATVCPSNEALVNFQFSRSVVSDSL